MNVRGVEMTNEKIRLIVLPPADFGEVMEDSLFEKHREIMRSYSPGLDFEIMPEGSELSEVPDDSFILANTEGDRGMATLMGLDVGVRARTLVARIGALAGSSLSTDEEFTSFLRGGGFAGGFPSSRFPKPYRIDNHFVGRVDLFAQCPSIAPRKLAGKSPGLFTDLRLSLWEWLPEYCQAVRVALGDGWGESGLPAAAD